MPNGQNLTRLQGRITRWDDDRGFGFVAWHGDGTEAFVHIKSFTKRSRRPIVGDIITYEVSADANGRLQANRIAYSRSQSSANHQNPQRGPIIFTCLFVAALAASVLLGRLPPLMLLIYLGMSIATFAMYGFDKSAARVSRRRTPESTLLFAGLLCGWPRALIAQRFLHHKSIKQSFQTAFLATVLINCIFIAWLASNVGTTFLRGRFEGG